MDTCTVVVGTPGILAPNSDNTMLSSTQAGGQPAIVTVAATAALYKVDIDSPTTFTLAPSGGDTDMSYATEFDATGVTTLTDIAAGASVNLNLGVTVLSIDATAQKTSGIFPAGSYSMSSTVECSSI
ncbi:MAG: hypothetical protein AAF603_08650 [Pseudomonadota bacterium]